MLIFCDKCGKELTRNHLKQSPKCMDIWPKVPRKKKGESVLEWFEKNGKPKK